MPAHVGRHLKHRQLIVPLEDRAQVVVGADQKVARIDGKWLITQLIAATPVLTP